MNEKADPSTSLGMTVIRKGEIVDLAPVKVIQILNPFRPATERKETVLACVPGELVTQTLARAGITLRNPVVTVNGALLAAEELPSSSTRPGDWITVAMGVGGGMWKTLATIALVAGASIIAPGVGTIVAGQMAADFGIVLSSAAVGLISAVAGAAIVAAGNLVISAFSGMFQSSVSALNVTQTYNPTGPNTTAQPGGVIPKGYGVMGWGGNIISSFVNFDGTGNEYVNVLVCFGMGAAKAITNLLVNGKPTFGYRELTSQIRLGSNAQTPIFGFNETVNGYPQDIEMLNASGPVVVPGTGTLTQELQVSVKFPGGLIRYDNSGNPKEVSYAYKLEYASGNGGAGANWQPAVAPRDVVAVTTVDSNGFVHYPYWVVMPTDRFAGAMICYSTDTDEGAHTVGEHWQYTTDVKVYSVDNSNYTYGLLETGEWQPYDAANPLQLTLVNDWWSGWRIVSQMTTTPFYDNVSIMGLTAGQWSTRVTFWGAGPHDQPIPQGDVTDTHYTAQGWLWNINEVEYNDFSYPNMILVGIRCLSTSQLSGQNMQVMATITHDIGEDTTLPPELSSFEHDNPAIVAFDILTNPLYGMAQPWSNIDILAFLTWAQFCDETVSNSTGGTQRRFVFAGVFDQASNAWACLQKVGQMSRAMPVRVGAMYSVVLDAPSDPVQIFTVGNILADSLQETWIGLDDRCNLVDVTFADALRTYRSDLPVSVIGASAINSALPPKTTRVSLLGCTNRDQAWQWAYFQLLSTQLLLRMIEIKVPIEGVTCQIGSVIGIQHDVPQWGWGGRVQAGSTQTVVNIDRDDLPPFVEGAGWTLSVQHPNVNRGTATITGTSTDSSGETFVTVNALPGGRLLLMVSASGKTQAKVFTVNGTTVQISGLGDIAVGQTVTFYDQNVIENHLVASVVGTAVTLNAALQQAPETDSPWVYGQSLGFQPATLFRVTDLKQSSDFEVTIRGLEYNTLIYEDVVPDYGEVVSAPTVNASVSELTLAENYQTANPTNPTVSLISVGWKNGPNTVGALIYMRPNDLYYPTLPTQAWQLLANVKGTQYSFWATQGVDIEVQVVGFDNLGNPAPQNTAPTATILVLGATGLPAAVTDFAVVGATVPPSTQTAPGPEFQWTSVDAESSYEIRFVSNSFGPDGGDWSLATVMADIAPASAAGVTMTWTAPQNAFGAYLISAYVPVPKVVNGQPTGYMSSAYSTPCQATYGTVADWQPILGLPSVGPTNLRVIKVSDLTPIVGLMPAQAGADVTAQNGNILLQNPNFENGSAGWTLGAGWTVIAGAGYGGSPNFAHFVPGPASAITNQQTIPCAPGNVVSASAMAEGYAGAVGKAFLRIYFLDANGAYITEADGPAITPNIGWQQSRAVGTAPAGTALAQVNFTVYTETAAPWNLGGFTAALQANSLQEVPDGTSRYAGVDPSSDQTVNRTGASTLNFPTSAVSAPANQETACGTITFTSTSADDVFMLLATLPFGGGGTAQFFAKIDGLLSLTFGSAEGPSPVVMLATFSQVAAGSHEINFQISPSAAATVALQSCTAVLHQAAAAGGFISSPGGGAPIVRPGVR